MAKSNNDKLKAVIGYLQEAKSIINHYEQDITISKRYKYLGIKGDYKLYEEVSTGHITRILNTDLLISPVS